LKIINCQKIVIFEEGKIVEQGTHRGIIEKKELIKNYLSSSQKV